MSISIEDLFISARNLDDNIIRQLVKAIEKSNLDGFDYLEFKHSLNQLIEMGMDEDVAVKSAYVTASSMGLTEAKLFNSAKHYQKVLSGEKEKFGQALKKQVEMRIKKREEQIEKLRIKVQQIEEKIEDLKKNGNELSELIETAESEIAESKTVIASTQERFKNAFQTVSQEISKDIESYKQALSK